MSIATDLMMMYYAQNSKPVMPTNGLVLYVPLDKHTESAATGQTLVYVGDDNYAQYATYKNVPCRILEDQKVSQIKIDYGSWLPAGNARRTMSFWYCRTSITRGVTLANYGVYQDRQAWSCCEQTNGINLILHNYDVNPYPLFIPASNSWCFVLYTFDGTCCRIYINGTQHGASISRPALNTATSDVSLMTSGNFINGFRMAGIRIYNRVLTAKEITTLASEFTPTA